MKQVWTEAELSKHWLLGEEDGTLLKGKTGTGRLALAIQLKYYQLFARFPKHLNEVAPVVQAYLCDQVAELLSAVDDYDFMGRTSRQHRRAILSHLNIQAFNKKAAARFRVYLIDTVLPIAPG